MNSSPNTCRFSSIKSPLRYPGGKSKAVAFLSKFVPDFKEFREPMCGGASMTLYFAQKKPDARYIMGDINYDLYCFWKTLKENPESLVREIYNIKNLLTDGKNSLKNSWKEEIDLRIVSNVQSIFTFLTK